MIERLEEPESDRVGQESARRGEPGERSSLERMAFVVPWATGGDTALDGLLRLQALMREPGQAAWRCFDVWCDPRPEAERAGADSPHATQRMLREFGATSAQLANSQPAREAWHGLLHFLGDAPVLIPELAAWSAWSARLAPGTKPSRSIALHELAALLQPGQSSIAGEALVQALLPQPLQHTRAFGPLELRAAAAELVARWLQQELSTLELAAIGYGQALRRLRERRQPGAAALELALGLLDRPSTWAERRMEQPDGWLSRATAGPTRMQAALRNCTPRGARAWSELRRTEPLPVASEDELRLDEHDLSLLDRVYERELPRLLGTQEEPTRYRPGQHEVAREVARSLGQRELLLMHAPTGTGKTLAYLVPALLWSLRQGVRVGIATYTRALQDQAMSRDVPAALCALERAGVGGRARVALLKGRNNYLCWRALALQTPESTDSAGYWLAWTQLALFGLCDAEGDLDRMPLRCELPGAPAAAAKELAGILSRSRADVGCCSAQADRDTCLAEAARRRAERAHVIVTNHSFALARRELFRHVIFDECEHLHDQARSAFSHEVSLRDLETLLGRLHEPGAAPERSALARVEHGAPEGSEAARCAELALQAHAQAGAALANVERSLSDFRAWREGARRSREERDCHSLFREYAQAEEGSTLLAAHASLCAHLNELGVLLAQLSEHIDLLAMRGAGRSRRSLDLARIDLEELLAALCLCIPVSDGRPCFAAQTFYDLEVDPRGGSLLVARALLPHEHLGRHYFPELATGICISATTWLRGGFEASASYLGLWRAAHPAPDELRPPCVLRTFRAGEIFDYERVMVLVPRDAPAPGAQGGAPFAEYVRGFVAHLGERTRGRMLVLFTNAEMCIGVGRALVPFFAERGIPFWFQRMPGTGKEELAELFRAHTDSVLLGLDTFWFGADFPGETLEYLVIVRLPYGVPDSYHHAQCASIGAGEQRSRIYLPRALAKFRQGFGRLMRRESDRGCVFVLDGRALEPRHRLFLAELPLQGLDSTSAGLARLARGDTDHCVREALAHMGMLADVRARGLDTPFGETRLPFERTAGVDDLTRGGSAGGEVPF